MTQHFILKRRMRNKHKNPGYKGERNEAGEERRMELKLLTEHSTESDTLGRGDLYPHILYIQTHKDSC